MKKRMLKLGLAIFACALVFFNTAGFLASATQPALFNDASSTGNAQEDREKAQQRMKDVQNELSNLRTNIDSLTKNIKNGKDAVLAAQQRQAALEKEAALIEEQINLKLSEINFKELEISTKIEEIDIKQGEYDKNEKVMIQRLVATYKGNNSSPLSLLLNVDDFSAALVLAENMRRISINDTELLDKLDAERIALEADKADLETMLVGLEAERVALDKLFADYNASIAEQKAKETATMQKIKLDEASKAQALALIEEYQKEMEDLWKTLGDSSGPYIGGELLWPVPDFNGKEYISSNFGQRTLYGRPNFHTGTDVARGPKNSIQGAKIVAANSGTVVMVSTSNAKSGYGYYLIIDHGGGIKTLYAHCDTISAQKGDLVAQGQQVATVGNTGNSTGPHLHFELRKDNKAEDSIPYLNGTKSLA